jgi:hypothetical protein
VRPLVERKTRLLARIAARREQAAALVTEVVRPWQWVDDAWSAWRSLPFVARRAAGPAARALLPMLFPRASRFMRWLPLLAAALRPVRPQRPM